MTHDRPEKRPEKRIVSIHFPSLAMDNWTLRRTSGSLPDRADEPPGDRPFALVTEGPHGFTLSALNLAARTASLRPAQKLTDARTICPELLVEPADPYGDARRLHRLALWAQRWCPWTAVDGSDTLLLDVTGAAHLSGGEAGMVADMAHRLQGLGHGTRIAVAPTVGAAWALSHHGGQKTMIALPDDAAAGLAPLRVAALRLNPATVLLLGRLGLKTIGALAAVPRLALARRFAREEVVANPLIRLDQAMGRLDEPVTPLTADFVPRVVRRLTEPVVHLAILTPLIADMAEALCATLQLRQLGARALRIDHFRVDGGVQTVTAETARATRDPAHIVRLIGERLDGLDAGFGFDAVAMTAVRHERVGAAQDHLLDTRDEGAALPHLIDRLSAKLGPHAVRRAVAVQSHVPERSVAWRSALDGSAVPTPTVATDRHRPIRLLDRPEEVAVIYATPEGLPWRFRWRRLWHPIARVEGPERIAPEWWRERSTARLRDYYHVEDDTGRRYWLFREGVAGDGRGDEPSWYLHGLFA